MLLEVSMTNTTYSLSTGMPPTAARGVVRSPAMGIVLDSLCDTSSFGALPALLLAAYGVRIGQPIACAVLGLIYFACVILRLRRYTVNALAHATEQRTAFAGLPSPVAAMSVAASVLASIATHAAPAVLPIVFGLITAPLMLSQVPYQETPRVAAWVARAIWPLPVLAVIGYFAGNAAVALAVFFAAYVASGFVLRRPAR